MDVSLHISLTEQDIVLGCAAQETWAQQRLYEQFYPKLMAVSLRYANNKDEALDILHESFIKIFKNISKFQPNTSLMAWMKTIVVNTSIDMYRKAVRHRTEDIDGVYDLVVEDTSDAIDLINEQDIIACIQKLSPVYRSVFNLYVIEGYSHKEIGELLCITESTSRSNLVKARTKLKELISKSF